MNKKILGVILSLLIFSASAQTLTFTYPTFTKTLPNGLKIIVCEKPTNNLVEVQVWYKTGSKDEWDGVRGMAHMFEHMMFRGSKNYPGEGDVFIDSLESFGGQVNAYTSFDRTVYHETIPSEKLENVLSMEADRMVNLTLSQKTLDIEREVVGQELRNGESNWFQKMAEQLYDSLYPPGHPYNVDVIGYLPQITAFTTAQCQAFYDKFYSPNNAYLIIVGNVKHEDAFAKAEKNFGGITKHLDIKPLTNVPDIYSDTLRAKNITVDFPVQIYGYMIPKPAVGDSDFYPFIMLKNLLFSNPNSILNQKIVTNMELAYTIQEGSDDYSLYTNICQEYIVMNAAPGNVKVKKVVAAEIQSIIDDGIDEKLMKNYLSSLKSQVLGNAYSNADIANQLGVAEYYLHDFTRYNEMQNAFEKISPEKLQQIAKKYFDPKTLRIVNIKPAE